MKLILNVIFIGHFLGLIWLAVAVIEEKYDQSSWLTAKDIPLNNNFWTDKYIYSIYWSITTMTSVGYVNKSNKQLY
jgi:TRAP-type C4-dicarboxylate transport system permease small subunit